MALTPIVIPKRAEKDMVFNGPFTELAGTSPTVLRATTAYHPYFQIAGMINGGLDFSFIYLKGLDLFGVYNPSQVDNDLTQQNQGNLSENQQAIYINSSGGFTDYSLKSVDQTQTVDVGALSTDYSLNLTGANRFLLETYVRPGYTVGIASLWGKDDMYFITRLDNMRFNCFQLDSDYNLDPSISTITSHNGSINYTSILVDPNAAAGPNVYLAEWVPTTFNIAGGFTQNNYAITLSDAADDADFQTGIEFGAGGFWHMFNNGRFNFIEIRNPAETPLLHLTVFVFANDYSWYERINISTNDPNILEDTGIYFQDIDGIEYLIGPNAGGTNLKVQAVLRQAIVQLSDVWNLGCWSPCMNMLIKLFGKAA